MSPTENIRDKFPIYHTNWLNRITIINLIEEAAGKYAKGNLLDVGCGAKQYRSLFLDYVDSYLGLDLRLAPASSDAGPNLLASVLETPLPDNTFQTVVSFQVLEHVPEPQIMMNEIYRVLKPGGYLILMAPQMWHLHEVPHDYFRYTRFGLSHLAERSGLRVITIQPISGFWIRAGLVISYKIAAIFGRPGASQTRQVINYSMITVSNLLFRGFDRLWPKIDDPINNLLIAQKCP